jgi:hypothetical protein
VPRGAITASKNNIVIIICILNNPTKPNNGAVAPALNLLPPTQNIKAKDNEQYIRKPTITGLNKE